MESGDCFDAPQHIPFAFVVRVNKKNTIVNIACLPQINACYAVKIYKKQFQKYFQTGGGGARPLRRSWIRLCLMNFV